MKILVVSNLFPPYNIGGYEIGCRDAVDELLKRGHSVTVLTSQYGVPVGCIDGHIHRLFKLRFSEQQPRKLLLRELSNQRIFARYCRQIRPDMVFFWKMTDISMGLVSLAREMGLQYCFYVFDHWMNEWRDDGWFKITAGAKPIWEFRILARLLRLRIPPVEQEFTNAIFASRYLQLNALTSNRDMDNSMVIPWGIDHSLFSGYGRTFQNGIKHILYVGQIVRHKGVHVAIEAFSMAYRVLQEDIFLTIVGDTEQDPAYFSEIQRLVAQLNLQDKIKFTGKIQRENLPLVYRSQEILLFPSLWEEPFGITPLEAMACGLVVVSSGTGGGAEYLRDGWNALLYQKNDASDCALQIVKIISNQELYSRISINGQQTVAKKFNLSAAIDKLEHFMKDILQKKLTDQ